MDITLLYGTWIVVSLIHLLDHKNDFDSEGDCRGIDSIGSWMRSWVCSALVAAGLAHIVGRGIIPTFAPVPTATDPSIDPAVARNGRVIL